MPLSSLFSRLYSAIGMRRSRANFNRLYLVFGTGRCGTSLLAQYFGGIADKKVEWRNSGQDLIAHEPFDSLNTFWEMVAAKKKGLKTNFVEEILLPQLKLQQRCRYCLLTDNKLGRWFFPEVLDAGLDVKILYLHRSPEDVLPSLRKCTDSLETLYWCYEDTDANMLTSEKDPHLFHIKETEKQWDRLRKQLDPSQYLEVSYERFIAERSHRVEVEKFLDMSGNEDLLKRKTNTTESNYKI